MLDTIRNIFHTDPLSFVITALAVLFLFMLWRESKKENLDWRDLITQKGSNKVSLTKVLQLVGGVTGTWIVISLTLEAKLPTEIFTAYLAYVGAIEGWSKFVAARYGGQNMSQRGYEDGYNNYPPPRYGSQYSSPYRHPTAAPPPPTAAKPPPGDDVF